MLYIDGGHIWSSPHVNATSISAIAVLLDNGNLVIRDLANSSMVIWQSFDNPNHVLLPGGHLGFSPITSKNTTLVTYSFLYNISYTLSLDATTKRGFIIQQSPGGRMFAGTFPEWIDIHEDGDYALAFNDVHTYMHLTSSGIIRFAKSGSVILFYGLLQQLHAVFIHIVDVATLILIVDLTASARAQARAHALLVLIHHQQDDGLVRVVGGKSL